MTECYKLLFDLSLYYTVFGYYLSLAVSSPPSAVCYLALAASILLDSRLRTRRLYEKGARVLRFLPLLLPVLAVVLSLVTITSIVPPTAAVPLPDMPAASAVTSSFEVALTLTQLSTAMMCSE